MDSKNLVILHKKVSKIGNGSKPSSVGRIISLPKVWVEEHNDPRKVVVCLGDLLIVGTEEDEERIQEIGEHLVAQGMLKPIGAVKHVMKLVGEKHGCMRVGRRESR